MNPETRRIVTEELWRSVVWAGLGLVGWAIIVSEFAWVDGTLVTVFGLPILTWAVLTGGMIGVRLRTEGELQVGSQAGIVLSVIVGILLGGVAAIFLVTRGYSALWVGSVYVVTALATALWSWYAVLPGFETSPTA
ncbi:hypothetical protein [Natrinema longum]|uniref:Uncharacterized protein n=1 Tax=Natrinema longum TaxID=370324 RepID=A0A8A2UCX8_9EURY|nr:hypothetical protein [Natrinema longum]MBZ6495527.1 hypothetical protein [Natrinema longum]QSW86507.1 hypothetical protein J0X27_06730 [Natrinema longum]